MRLRKWAGNQDEQQGPGHSTGLFLASAPLLSQDDINTDSGF